MKSKKIRRRVIAMLSREEIEFVDKLGMDALFSTGRRLSRVDIISALVEAVMKLGITGKGVKSKSALVEKILNSFRIIPERRKYPRIEKKLIAGFRKADSLKAYKNGSTGDISLGGFRMEIDSLDEPLIVNQIVEITLAEPESKTEPVKAIGRVAWLKEKDKRSYEVGVALTYIHKEVRDRFLKFMGEASNKAENPYLPEDKLNE